jgi:hypothetical protein
MARKVAVLPGMYQTAVPAKSGNPVINCKLITSVLRIGTVGGTCECGNEPSDSIKYGEFLD